MAAKKAASAAANSQKKRKRDKVEDGGNLKKRKSEESKKNTPDSKTNTPTRGTKTNGQLVKASGRGGVGRTTWKLSEPMGGSIADIDPVFTADEQHLILAYTNLIQVYSTSDSLLERRIKLPQQNKTGRPRRIVATALSPKSPELVWAGCSDGALFRINWATGSVENMQRSPDAPTRLVGLSAEVISFHSGPKEVLFLSEGAPGSWHVSLYDATAAALSNTAGRRLFSSPKTADSTTAIEHLRTIDNGQFLAAASGQIIFVGRLKQTDEKLNTISDLTYEILSFDAADEVSSLDLRSNRSNKSPKVDLLLGSVRGPILMYDNVLRLRGAATGGFRERIYTRKFHWHRSVVNSVKWSRDGNYFVSGGTEQTLVVWQLDTNRKDFLPHLSATIESIVISPRGASYALHLDDNSAMVLSTTEMRPTCYVSGLQTLTFAQAPRKDANVRRAWAPIDTITQPIPAVVNPADASRICLRVGNGQKAAKTGEMPSTSNLQIFDVSTFQSVAKQPLARTNPTDSGLTPRGFPVTEPTITQLCTSHDGQWLVSVDEWQPPPRDISGISGEPSLQDGWARERREVHLKFWSMRDGRMETALVSDKTKGDSNRVFAAAPSYDLVTRIDEAHFTTEAETIFGVAADGRHANRFATLGDDAVVRFWGVKTRIRDGLVMKDRSTGQPLVGWHCTQTVPLPLGSSNNQSVATRDGLLEQESQTKTKRSGALTFSEDGSTVFAAFGARDEAVLYTIDAESGAVRETLEGMFRGDVRGVGILGSALVLLSADLRVYDIVADELQYGIHLDDSDNYDSNSAALTQLALGRASRTFVVSVPETDKANGHRPVSKVMVFSPDHAQPLFVQTLPTLVLSLLPTVGLSGFLAIDAAAQVWSVVDAADTAALGKPLSELNLPTEEEEPKAIEDAAAEDSEDEDAAMADDDEEEEEAAVNGIENGDDEYDDESHQAVIAPQKLRDIFEAAPATATTSIEELFWQVSGLLTALPNIQAQ